MRKVEQDDCLANFTVGKAHPTWKPGLLIDNHASGAYRRQLRVALAEERCELLGFQSNELKRTIHVVAFQAATAGAGPEGCRVASTPIEIA